MEYVNATLSGILLWLFIFFCVRQAQKRSRTWGGETLIDVGYPRRTLIKKVGLGIFLLSPMVFYLLMFVMIGNYMFGRATLSVYMICMQLFQFILFAIQSIKAWLMIPLEIRENGIILRSRFWPWGAIKFCRYSQFSRTLVFHLQGRIGWPVVAQVPSERKEAILEVVARYVEIRDYSGDVLSRPPTSEEGRESNAVLRSRGKYSPFQFDILTLLFLMVVVAVFAGWYGILFRRNQAIAEQKNHFQEKYESVEFEVVPFF
jgi:hypothetical protein